MKIILSSIILFLSFFSVSALSRSVLPTQWTDTQFPAYIKRLNYFGERPEWSHDGKKILFIGHSFGAVYELEVATGKVLPLTHHYYNGGYLRAHYLSNGDILLAGPEKFDPSDWRNARFSKMQLWVLSKNLDQPAVPLGTFIWEGPAVSRTELTISWAAYADEKGVRKLMLANIDYSTGKPTLINQRVILDNTREDIKGATLEPQNFIPHNEHELTVQVGAWKRDDIKGAEVFGLNIKTGAWVNYSKLPLSYDEPEGIFPDGQSTLVESAQHDPDPTTRTVTNRIDLYRLSLRSDVDDKQKWERMTYFSEEGKFKASNPVVSDDGKYIAFMVAKTAEFAGTGHGIYILDIDAYKKSRKQ